jgi:D-glycero-D-manno-heptose 1,7-bisphosphate phosphatase
MKRAVFLDRDGVINRKPPEGQYVTRWEQIEILPGVVEALTAFNRSGFSALVVSNQRCVAKGLLTSAELDSIHQRMSQELAAAGAVITAFYYCPHEKEPACACRKPAPGMLFEAANAHGIDLGLSWMIGDSESDIEAGRRAGCKTIQIVDASEPKYHGADLSARSLRDAAHKIVPFRATETD